MAGEFSKTKNTIQGGKAKEKDLRNEKNRLGTVGKESVAVSETKSQHFALGQ